MENSAQVAIIGGSGLYDVEMLEGPREIKVHTPYGKPSDVIILGNYKGKQIAFLSRHGRGHQTPPHLVNYRANIWALKQLGVQRILASNACGSLREDYRPGDLVIVDQFVDRTKERKSTFYEGPQVCHISSADPFCSQLRGLLADTTGKLGYMFHPKGTFVVIEGPRFSTRAESRMFRQWGGDVLTMTVFPECVLAREAEICYASLALVTDYDCLFEHPVNTQEIIEVMKSNVNKAKQVFASAIENMPAERNCGCGQALKNAIF